MPGALLVDVGVEADALRTRGFKEEFDALARRDVTGTGGGTNDDGFGVTGVLKVDSLFWDRRD